MDKFGFGIVFLTVWLAYACTYLIRKPLGVVKKDLGEEMELDKTQLGWLDTSLILPYALVQIALPHLSEEYGSGPVLTLSIIFAGGCCFFTSFITNYYMLAFVFFLTGAFLAPCWPACSSLLMRFFPARFHNTIFGVINTATYLGSFLGTAQAAYFLNSHGWRSVFLLPSVCAAIVTLLLMFTFKFLPLADRKITAVECLKEESQNPNMTDSSSTLALLKITCVKELAVAMFCLKFVRYMMYMWLPLYMVETLHYSGLQAGLFSTVFDVGGMLGSPFLGVVLDKMCTNRPMWVVFVVMLIGSASISLFTVTSTMGMFVNGIFLFIAGAANCGPDSLIAGSITMKLGEDAGFSLGPGVTSLVNGLGNLGGMIEGPVVGAAWTVLGWSGVIHGGAMVMAFGAFAVCRAHRLSRTKRSHAHTRLPA